MVCLQLLFMKVLRIRDIIIAIFITKKNKIGINLVIN